MRFEICHCCLSMCVSFSGSTAQPASGLYLTSTHAQWAWHFWYETGPGGQLEQTGLSIEVGQELTPAVRVCCCCKECSKLTNVSVSIKHGFFLCFYFQALQAAFQLPSDVDQAEARSRWQDAHLNPDQRDFSIADHKFKEVANQVNNDINKVLSLTSSLLLLANAPSAWWNGNRLFSLQELSQETSLLMLNLISTHTVCRASSSIHNSWVNQTRTEGLLHCELSV